MKFGLDQDTINKINGVLSTFHGIDRVLIYGSRAKGDYTSGSDIDLTIISKDFDVSDLAVLETRLDDLYLPYKIDVSVYHRISNPDLIKHIRRVGATFYERDS
jgi:predicted nucleotidyltransferase